MFWLGRIIHLIFLQLAREPDLNAHIWRRGGIFDPQKAVMIFSARSSGSSKELLVRNRIACLSRRCLQGGDLPCRDRCFFQIRCLQNHGKFKGLERAFLSAFLMAMIAGNAFGALPFITEDADTLGKGTSQVRGETPCI